ncbi:signal transducing adapter molecule 1-like [Liolophura sinensis]|uniref:signal transducing adapter molecule 1-like n=1 Tax=Liolophura sinensis TaxID=3198878 RepID=UPI0031581CE0
MPWFSSSSPFDGDVEKATNEMNTQEDWAVIMEVCDKVTRSSSGSKDCLRSIVKRMNHRVPHVSMQALTLLDACVKNCGRNFHLEICSRDFVGECRSLIGQKAHPRVAQKLKLLIKKWAEMSEFKDDPALNLIPSFYKSLKDDGQDFADLDSTTPKTVQVSTDPNVVQSQQEEDDIAKAIALSLKEAEKSQPAKVTSLYPTAGMTSYPTYSTPLTAPKQKEVRKVRALYDFEAAEDNELTFKAGELISVLDDSDANWWKGYNHRGEGLFPANFVTADLSVEPEESKSEKKVQFSEEVEVKTVEPVAEELEIDEGKIEECLQMIQNADPTGETQPDTPELIHLEEQCKGMGPLIDMELEQVDRKHNSLMELNAKVVDALQMYHSLMKEIPGYMGKPSNQYPAPSLQQQQQHHHLPQQQYPQPIYNGQAQYMPQGGLHQGQTTLPQGMVQQQQPQGQHMAQPSQQQHYNSAPASISVSSYGPQVSTYNPQGEPSQSAMQPSMNMQTMYATHQMSAPPQMYQAQQQPLL